MVPYFPVVPVVKTTQNVTQEGRCRSWRCWQAKSFINKFYLCEYVKLGAPNLQTFGKFLGTMY